MARTRTTLRLAALGGQGLLRIKVKGPAEIRIRFSFPGISFVNSVAVLHVVTFWTARSRLPCFSMSSSVRNERSKDYIRRLIYGYIPMFPRNSLNPLGDGENKNYTFNHILVDMQAKLKAYPVTLTLSTFLILHLSPSSILEDREWQGLERRRPCLLCVWLTTMKVTRRIGAWLTHHGSFDCSFSDCDGDAGAYASKVHNRCPGFAASRSRIIKSLNLISRTNDNNMIIITPHKRLWVSFLSFLSTFSFSFWLSFFAFFSLCVFFPLIF